MIYGNIFGTRAPEPGPVRRPYMAYGLAQHEKPRVTVEISREDGSRFRMEETDLLDVITSDDGHCALIYDKCLLELTGRHLGTLPELLRHYDLGFAQRFDPERHDPPPEDSPLIDGLRWKPIAIADNQLIPARRYQSNAVRFRMI